MNALDESLSHLPEVDFGDVVHVHPHGAEVLAWAIRRRARRTVAVSPDADVRTRWRELSVGLSEPLWIDAAMSASKGSKHWLRFNVSELNGLQEPAGLRQIYPRLKVTEKLPVQVVGLLEVLERIPAAEAAEGPDLLVLERPGDALALMAGLGVEHLRRFDWILLVWPRDGLYQLDNQEAAIAALLGERGYLLRFDAGTSDTLWRTALYQFNEQQAEISSLRAEIRDLNAEKTKAANVASQQLATDAAERSAQAGLLAAKAAELGEAVRLQGEQRRSLEAQASKLALHVTREADAARLAEEQAAKIADLIRVRDQYSKQARDRLAEVEKLQKSNDESATLAEQRGQQLDDLQTAHETLAKASQDKKTQLEQLVKARDDLNKRLVERDAQLGAANQAKVQLEKVAQERQNLIEQLTRVRDEHAKQSNERQKQVARLDAEMNDLSARHAVLQEELLKAEAHVELIADLLLRDPAR